MKDHLPLNGRFVCYHCFEDWDRGGLCHKCQAKTKEALVKEFESRIGRKQRVWDGKSWVRADRLKVLED